MDELQQALDKYYETLKNPDPDITTHLANVQARIEDVNSAMPETKIFLEKRGLSSVRELDARGRAALVAHLQNTIRLFTAEQDTHIPS